MKGLSTLKDTLPSSTYMVPYTPLTIEPQRNSEPSNELQTALEAVKEKLHELRQKQCCFKSHVTSEMQEMKTLFWEIRDHIIPPPPSD